MKSIVGLFLILGVGTTQGAAPLVKKSGPGFYRFMVGSTEVTTLLDGGMTFKPAELLKGIQPAEIGKLLTKAFEGESVYNCVSGFLVNTGAKLVLIDTGMGAARGAALGHLVENLKASGYQPDQVDEVYITHGHGDHVGGLTSDGQRNYPQAVVRADGREIDHWFSEREAAKVDEKHKAFFDSAKIALAPYKAADRLKSFSGETELVPGVHAHPTYGHTPGHTVYTVESDGKKLWLLGDMIHVAAVQFPKPQATLAFDWDQKLAKAERARIFAGAAKARDLIAAAHLPFPAVGHIAAAGSGFAFTPLSYAPVGD